MPKLDEATLQAAVVGFTAQLDTVNQKIAEIQNKLGGRAAVRFSSDGAKPKGKLSASARRRIAAAQKKRWAAFRAKKAAPKRKLSAAAKAKLVANLAKARAAKAEKAKATA